MRLSLEARCHKIQINLHLYYRNRLTSVFGVFFFCFFLRSQVLNCFFAAGPLSPFLPVAAVSSCLMSLLSPVECCGCCLQRGGKQLIESIEAKRKLTTTAWLVLLFCLEMNGAASTPETGENASLGHFLCFFVFFLCICFLLIWLSIFLWLLELQAIIAWFLFFSLPFKCYLMLFDYTGSLNLIWMPEGLK